MKDLRTIPLHIFEVLEQEFLALHGVPYDTLEVKLSDSNAPDGSRVVTSLRKWDFHPSHIKDASALTAHLVPLKLDQTSSEAAGSNLEEDPEDCARKNLRDYIWNKLDRATQEELENAGVTASLLPTLTTALNTLLTDQSLFSEERFSIYWLSEATKELKTSCDYEAFKGDDLAHFNRLLLEDAFSQSLIRIHNIRLAAIYQVIHEKKPAALSLSGGGIRSGTFALGLLQGLARNKLLDKFHYLSTVSGGGYIGSWLAAWIHRHPRHLAGVTSELANTEPTNKIDPDPDPIRYLRRYSNFITPKVGLLSADTWTFLGIYLRNLFLNWIVFIPLLLSAVLLPRLIIGATLPQPKQKLEPLFTLSFWGSAIPVYGRRVFLIIGFLMTSWALAYIIFNRPTLRNRLRQNSRFWRSRTGQRSFLWACLLPLVLAAFSLTTYWSWSSVESVPKRWEHFFYFGLSVCLFAWLLASFVLGRLKLKYVRNNWHRVGTIEWLALLFAGIAGGTVLWLLTRSLKPIEADPNFWWDYWTAGRWLDWKTEWYVCLAVPAFMLVFLLGATLFIGGSSASPRIDDEDREWWARLSAWVLISILGWTAFSTIVIFGPIALLSAPKIIASVGGISGIAAALIGKSAKTKATSKSQNQNGSLIETLAGKLLPILAAIFIVTLLVFLSLVTTAVIQSLALIAKNFASPFHNLLINVPHGGFDQYLNYIYYNVAGSDEFERAKIAHMNVLHHTSFWFVLILGLLLFGLGLLASRLMNLNLFSLHGGYRTRLIRAFLGASRPDHERTPNPFTGFDPADNISVHELRAGLLVESDFPDPVKLAKALLDRNNKTSQRLAELELLSNFEAVPNKTILSTRLVSALRKYFNSALAD